MRTLSDTDPRVERVQIELLRKATVAQRFGLARSLSQSVIELARRAIRRRGAHEDVRLVFIEQHYGAELAERVAVELARRCK